MHGGHVYRLHKTNFKAKRQSNWGTRAIIIRFLGGCFMGEKKKHRGPAPVVISKKTSDWIKDSSMNSHINNYKVGGGIKQK